MVTKKAYNTAACMLAGVLCMLVPGAAHAAEAVKLSGSIAGVVNDSRGVPQMGATVTVYNHQARQVGKVLSDQDGQFRLAGLFPAIYSLRVTLASFVPAIRKDISVEAGRLRLLHVSLNTLFSSIQFAYPPIENGSLMSDEWKWVLRSASPTRPVLRFAGDAVANSTRTASSHRTAVFSDTRGVFKVSAGEGTLASGTGNEADMGTAFAVATSLYGSNVLQVSGNVGYGSQTGVPSAAFRTSYSRNVGGGSPEVSVTMRQLFLPGRFGAALTGNEAALPMLRTMAASFDDRTQLTSELSIQYGFTLNSISFLDHLNYASPYARVLYSLGENGEVSFAYTSGDARPDLAGSGQQDLDLQRELSTLGLFPRISLRDSRPRIQRGQNFELTYTRQMGSRTYQVSTYRESVSNAALSIVAPAGMYTGGDILPDLFSGTSTFDAGDFRSTGYSAP